MHPHGRAPCPTSVTMTVPLKDQPVIPVQDERDRIVLRRARWQGWRSPAGACVGRTRPHSVLENSIGYAIASGDEHWALQGTLGVRAGRAGFDWRERVTIFSTSGISLGHDIPSRGYMRQEQEPPPGSQAPGRAGS
jgi:hypothetical protein